MYKIEIDSIGEIIKILREKKQLSRETLANELFKSRQTIYNYEHGKRKMDVELFAYILNYFNATVMIKENEIILLEDIIMKNTKLEQILALNNIRDGIMCNLIQEKNVLDLAIIKTLKLNSNSASIEFKWNGRSMQFENALYYDEDKKIYLLESRLFDNHNDQMINAYLEILDNNFNIIDEYVDDVWSYTDWNQIV